MILTPNRYRNSKGEIGVLYTSDYGAGFSTWNTDSKYDGCEFNFNIISALLNNVTKAELIALCIKEYDNDFCTLGVSNLTIKWLPEGTIFYIVEYDGKEAIKIQKDLTKVA